MAAKKKKTSKEPTSNEPKGKEKKQIEPVTPEQFPASEPVASVAARFPIVGIGASAGGLEALELLFQHMPSDAGMAFVIIQHLDPARKSMMGELLQKYTKMKVLAVEDGTKLEPNTIYLNPPDKHVGIFQSTFQLLEPLAATGVRLPIDTFFRSLADDQGENSICIVLSGGGSDGALGLKAVKGAGGMTMVQEEEQAKYKGMPKSAIDTGLVDRVLTVEKMPQELLDYMRHPYIRPSDMPSAQDAPFENLAQKIFLLIRTKTGHDFSHYKQNTIRRRVERRMAVHKVVELREYVRFLQGNPAEIEALFKDLLITVTSFFRDSAAFDILKKDIIPELVQRQGGDSPVRIWVPACASGEEAYSIAMIVSEVMDMLGKHLNVQIFATDIDPNAIEDGRVGVYPDSIAADVTPERLAHFFIMEENRYKIKKQVREMVVFAIQNLITDPPFSKIDLISCRNLLIYLDPTLQKKILPMFHYALNQEGYLFLGSSESIAGFADLFQPLEPKWKIFQRKGIATERHPLYMPISGVDVRDSLQMVQSDKAEYVRANLARLAERMVLEEYGPAAVVVNEKNEILYFMGSTDRYLAPPKGEASFHILKMVRESLRYPLTTALHKVVQGKKTIVAENIVLKGPMENRRVDVVVRPLIVPGFGRNLSVIIFNEKEPARMPKTRKKAAAPEIDPQVATLEQELQTTREYLQTTIEELETSNEELKSSNEELQSTNEELQSANEELETSKEELQSTNEELMTVNAELQNKIDELWRANDDMNNLLAGTEIGTIFLDAKMNLKRFTPASTKLFNLIPSDIGRPISDITSKMSSINLHKEAMEVLETLQRTELTVKSDDGAWFSVRILPYRTKDNMIDGAVVTFIDMTAYKRAAEQAEASRNLAQSIVDAIRQPLLILNSDLKVVSASASFYKIFKTVPNETEQKPIYDLGDAQWDIPRLRELLEKIIPNNDTFDDFEVIHDFPGIGTRRMLLNARRIHQPDGRPDLILLAMEDATDRNK